MLEIVSDGNQTLMTLRKTSGIKHRKAPTGGVWRSEVIQEKSV